VIFREPFHWTTVAGILLVIAGVVLITVRIPDHRDRNSGRT